MCDAEWVQILVPSEEGSVAMVLLIRLCCVLGEHLITLVLTDINRRVCMAHWVCMAHTYRPVS